MAAWRWCLALLVVACGARAQDQVIVVNEQLSFDETHTIMVNSSVEYILRFVPSASEAGEADEWLSELQVSVDSGEVARPLLLTVRRTFGASTWQLPFTSDDGSLQHALTRTLCPDDAAPQAPAGDCDGAEWVAGSLSLHVSTWCTHDVQVTLAVRRRRGWLLALGRSSTVTAERGAAAVRGYMFGAAQESVRLEVEAQDDVCATLAVQQYACPLLQDLPELQRADVVRMTLLRSAGLQLERSRFPHGFYVIVSVHATDAACLPAGEEADEWLWEAAVLGHDAAPRRAPAPRRKTLRLTPKAALSRGGYVVAGGVTLALFAAFYVAAGALVLAQRLPAWRRLVGPRAVLADPNATTASEPTETPARQRRYSTATFDSSDNSDTDEEEGDGAPAPSTVVTDTRVQAAAPTTVVTETDAPVTNNGHRPEENDVEENRNSLPANGNGPPLDDNAEVPEIRRASEGDVPPARTEQRAPFGLPARLHVAALARRRARVLEARSDRYFSTLCTVGLFYLLPVVQFVAAFQIVLNVSGSLDLCYYNFLCAHPAGGISDFNHVFSNVGYLLLGALFMLQVWRRRRRRDARPRDDEYGIPAHYGLLSALGAAMMMVALLSATYHICPNGQNFQFDTAFMYVLAVLCMVKIYQSRHPDINARAHATFGVLAVLIALVVWGVLGGGPLFWSAFTVLHVFTFLLLSLRIYYLGQFRFEKGHLAEAARGLRSRPLYSARLVMLLIANAVNWAFALYGLFQQSADFAGHVLSVLLCNVLMQMLFYMTMKLLHGERPRWYTWVYVAGAGAAWAPALYWFTSGSSDWASTPALSRARNHTCRVLQFYDAHDLWHLLSAVALYLSFNVLLTWDDGLAAVRRDQIAVF